MDKNFDYKVYLIDDELYALEYDFAHGEKPEQLKLTPLYNFLKDEKLVKNKENLKDRTLSTAGVTDWKNPVDNFKYMGTMFYHENGEASFSFFMDARNPFVVHPQERKHFFIIPTSKNSLDVNYIPYQAVMFYRLNYTDGVIYSISFILNNNSMVTVNGHHHVYYLAMIEDYNKWSSEKAAQ